MRTCRRKRQPIRCNNERTRFSGVVSLPRMRLMFQLRRALLKRSLLAAREDARPTTLVSRSLFTDGILGQNFLK
jgi:hypothetical protein